MSRNRDDWLTQIKAVERDYAAARFDIDRLLDAVEDHNRTNREHGRYDASDDEGRHGLFPPIR